MPFGAGNWLKTTVQIAIFSLIITIAYMLIPMVLIFTIPVITVVMFFEVFNLGKYPLLIFPGLLCGFYCGLILNIFLIPINLLVLPFYVYYKLGSVCYRRRSNIRNAENRLN